MNRVKLTEQMDIIAAWIDGVETQFQDRYGRWSLVTEDNMNLLFLADYSVRIKPKPRGWWAVINKDGRCLDTFRTKGVAERHLEPNAGEVLIKVQEVLDD